MKVLKKGLAFLALSMLLHACSSGTSLKEIGEMSATEKMGVTKLNISPMPEGMQKLTLAELLYGFDNLRELEIGKEYTGIIYPGNSNYLPEIEVFKAPGATTLGNELFNSDKASNLREVIAPNVIVLDSHCFGHNNKITALDFPKARDIGDAFIGCKELQVLKFGSDEPISISSGAFASYFGKVNTENIVLYLGKYEYENNVEGNVWNTYWYPASGSREDLEGASIISHTRWDEPHDGGQITFKEIRRY